MYFCLNKANPTIVRIVEFLGFFYHQNLTFNSQNPKAYVISGHIEHVFRHTHFANFEWFASAAINVKKYKKNPERAENNI